MRPVLPARMTQPAAQGGRTSTRVHTVVQPPWGRRRQRPVARRCAGRSPSMYGMFDPLGADDDGGTRLPRVRCAHPRLQSSATPAGPAASRNACTDVGMGTAVSQRHAAGMATGTAAPRMRCTDIGMGTAVPPRHAAGMTAGTASLPRFCSGMATRTAAPRGPNYSVTAGEHGEPAEGEPHI